MPTRRQLGQYFTPPAVVDLALALLQGLDPLLPQGTLLDPSCGEGAFLDGARRAGWAPERLYGLDSDPAMLEVWQAGGLGKGAHLAIADGLAGGGWGQFDVVAGNPPFAGTMPLAPPLALSGRFTWGQLGSGRGGALPRELWFLERSLRLLRPGGLLALVLPEGVFANRRWQPQRAALLAENQVEAIIGLPRQTFRAGRTMVKTCLLLARHHPAPPGHRVRLVELTHEEVLAGPGPLWRTWEDGGTVAAEAPWENVNTRRER